MPRLLRPSIPVEVRCRVVWRQNGALPATIEEFVHHSKRDRNFGYYLNLNLEILAKSLGCDVGRLHLDHDPPIGAREKVFDRRGKHVGYKPDANDPDHLIYREKRSHQIKTNVRGEHGQHPDRVLIKRQRRLEKRIDDKHPLEIIAGMPKPKRRKPKRSFKPKSQRWPKPKRKIRGGNRWPPKGSRSFGCR